jgi:hypothetical protein
MANAPQICPLTASNNPDVTALAADPGTIAKTLDGYFFKKYSTGSTDWTRFAYTDEDYYKSRACKVLSCSRLASWKWDDFDEKLPSGMTYNNPGGSQTVMDSAACGVLQVRLKPVISNYSYIVPGKLVADSAGVCFPSGSAGTWYIGIRFKSDSISTGTNCAVIATQADETQIAFGNIASIYASTTAQYGVRSNHGIDASASFYTRVDLDTAAHTHELWRTNGMTYYAVDGVIKVTKNIWLNTPCSIRLSCRASATLESVTGSFDWLCYGVPTGHRMT